MSAFSFKNFLTFVDMEDPTEQDLFEIFGFGDKKKVAALKAKNDELRAKKADLMAKPAADIGTRKGQADARGADKSWHDQRAGNTSDPRKVYKNKKAWRDAVDALGAKAAENTSKFAKDKNGNVIAKWFDDKNEGWIELREGLNEEHEITTKKRGGAKYVAFVKDLGIETDEYDTEEEAVEDARAAIAYQEKSKKSKKDVYGDDL